MKILQFFVIAFLASSQIAIADDHAGTSGSANFILLDYSINMSADTDEKDTTPLGDGSGNTTPINIDDGLVDDTSGFFGIGIGHRYSSNIAAVLRYETGELESGSYTTQLDTSFTNVSVGPTKTDVESFMLEAVYFMPYSEQVEFWGLLGIGRSELETSTTVISGTLSGSAVSFVAVCKRSKDNTSTRIGVGATYYMSQSNGFYGGITRSDYGDAEYNMYDNNACTSTPDTLTLEDTTATDFRIGYFVSF